MRGDMKKYILPLTLTLTLMGIDAFGGSIIGTKHNLSVSGPGPLRSTSKKEICVFCHPPPGPRMNVKFLWNRKNNTQYYIPYQSSTLYASVGQPTGVSKMCLSCHDGTIALGATTSMPTEIPFKGGTRYLPDERASHLGTDLSDDHPVSFVYDRALSLQNLELKDPELLHPSITLDKEQQLQCTACHDPHDDTFGRFLVMDNTGSALCVACHDKRGWGLSSHARSSAMLVRSDGLWSSNDYQTVAENGCENCHVPHSSGAGERLLNFVNEEDNCFACHDGGTATSDIASAMSRRFTHPVQAYLGIHDAAEDFTTGYVRKHVECGDCHNAHQANEDPSPGAPLVSGATRGVSGVSIGGAAVKEARHGYEICFKCHGDNNVVDTVSIVRQIDQLNTREEFNPANPSFHPVAAPGKNPEVPSLLPPYTVNSVIACTDCHGGNDPAEARGPHGSDYQHILSDRYVTDDLMRESASSYALCYRCHSRSVLMDGEVFPHGLHVQDQQTPCSACHDPHGVSAMQGNAVNNSHLINFDLTIVSPTGTGRLEYLNRGRFGSQCFLNCHGKLHDPLSYSD